MRKYPTGTKVNHPEFGYGEVVGYGDGSSIYNVVFTLAHNDLHNLSGACRGGHGFCFGEQQLETIVINDKTTIDNISKPAHYTNGNIETIDYIMDCTKSLPGNEAVLVGNVLKYVSRYSAKNGVEDLKKAQVYLGWLINLLEKGSIK